MNRAFLLMMLGNVVFGLWMRPELKQTRMAARLEASPTWAVLLLIASLALLAFCAVEVYLIHILREQRPREDR